ncbi:MULTISPECIES: ABC transporter substrate-binding protein [Cupriavidus]|uniref:ABC transporter substrate-binding protein n=1 Tax=Cupriavidus sp. WS TaxID=1312922 RepID=UPI0003795013|nr:ABC transporter substrate-binding protein [Cupriavidus sp. WS]
MFCAVASALIAWSAAARAADAGISDSEIVFGVSVAQSGPNAAYGAIGVGVKGCFDYLNAEQGGVKVGDGKTRKIKIETLDDAMEPARALQNARRFVEQSKVFAVIGNNGTGANLGTRSYYNAEKIPQAFIGSGGPMFGARAEVEKFPWTMLGYLSYNTEAAMYAEFIKQKWPNAKIALINDDSGGPFFADTFVKTAKALGLNIVAHEEHSYSEPTINAKISRLKESGADVFVEATTPKFVVQAIKQTAAINWKPVHIVWNVGASIGGTLVPAGADISKGIYSGLYIKDATNPAFANDEDMKTYLTKLKQYAPGANVADQNATMGWYDCMATKAVLERMKTPTRDAFMASIRSLDNVKVPILLEGIRLNTKGTADGYPIESVQIAQFDGVKFVPVGGVLNYEGRTPAWEPRAKSN